MKCGRVEKLFAVFTLVLFTQPFLPLVMRNGELSIDSSTLAADGNPLRQGLFLVAYAVAFVLLVKRRSLEWAIKDKPLLLLVVGAVISISWSEDPATTLKRTLALLGTVVVGAYLASNYSFKDVINLLAWSLGLVAVLSTVVALLAPSYGIMSDSSSGAWQGIYTHKNILGRITALGAISFFLLATSAPKHRPIKWGGFLLLTLVVIKSQSLTALLALLAILALIPAFMAMRRRPVLVPVAVAACVALGSATLWLSDSSDDLARALGRDLTFSGRVDLWQSAALVIGKSPWLGHGYGTSWVTGGEDATTDIAAFSEWNAPDAHDGFLTMALDLGLSGLALFVVGYAVTVGRAIVHFRGDQTIEALWPILFLCFVFLTNLTESLFLRYNSIDWTLYVATVLLLAQSSEPAGDTQMSESPWLGIAGTS